MGKKFITDKAQCMCKFGSIPGILNVAGQNLLNINASKKIATNQDLGDTFQPPGFGACNFSYPSRPCKVSVVQWTNFFKKIRIQGKAYPLLPDSKGICAIAGSPCIEIVEHGQIEILGSKHIQNTTDEFQNDLNPIGDMSTAYGLSEDIFILK